MTARTALITMQVESIEVDGKHFVDVTIGAQKLSRKGPYKNADTARATADQYIHKLAPNLPATTIANKDVVMLHGKPVELDGYEGRRFATDCCRAGEGILSDLELQQTWEISPEDFAQLEKNPALIKAIRDIRKQRIRSGAAARESACEIYAKTPAVVGKILNDDKMPARHRIEAAKEIRTQAIGGDGVESTAEATEKFVININLGNDVEPFRREVDITPRKFIVDHELSEKSDVE